MLQIDLKKTNKSSLPATKETPESNPNGLNSYTSLNRAVRIKEIARVADDNRSILGRLQGTKSHYSTSKWNEEYKHQSKIARQINSNGDRFCKNPYFLHSVCTYISHFVLSNCYFAFDLLTALLTGTGLE